MSSLRLSKKKSIELCTGLPPGAVREIADKLKITTRMVKYILDGEYGDRHGVIDLAIKYKKAEEVRRRFLLESIQ